MKRERVKREGHYPPIPQELLFRSRRMHCELCHMEYGKFYPDYLAQAEQIVDHIFPVRWLVAQGLNPHVEVNLISVCLRDHSRKLKYEDCLFRADFLGFYYGLMRLGYPAERVNEAARFYGLVEVGKFSASSSASISRKKERRRSTSAPRSRK